MTTSSSSLKVDSSYQLPCMPSCLSFSASAGTALAHILLMVNCSHMIRGYCSMPEAFHSFPRKDFCSIISLHCAAFTGCSTSVAWLTQVHSCELFPPCSVSIAASWKNLKLSSLHVLSHMCQAQCGSQTALGTQAELLSVFLTKILKPLLPRDAVLGFR